jgi:alpha-aminoadipate/glutamate carrier protein LysW
MVKCPVCDGAIEIEEDEVEEGDAISCDECGAELQVTGLNPLEVEAVEEADEDDEDEDGFLEEEEEEDEDWK